MERLPLRFVQVSLLYGIAGGVSALAWLSGNAPAEATGMAHLYLLTAGWMGMLLCGVAYHALPRFVGRPLHSRTLAVWHFYLANIGVLGVAACAGWAETIPQPLPRLFAAALALGLVLFAINLSYTLARSAE